MAAQFTATKGPTARSLASWIARATSSLPVPVSPKIVTVARVGAARPAWSSARQSTGLDPNTLQWDLTPTPTYRDLIDVAKIVTPSSSIGNDAKGLQGFTRAWDPLAGEPWLYRAGDQRFISYDDPHSIAERTQLIRSGHLHGAMVWELSQDSNDHALLDALSPLLR